MPCTVTKSQISIEFAFCQSYSSCANECKCVLSAKPIELLLYISSSFGTNKKAKNTNCHSPLHTNECASGAGDQVQMDTIDPMSNTSEICVCRDAPALNGICDWCSLPQTMNKSVTTSEDQSILNGVQQSLDTKNGGANSNLTGVQGESHVSMIDNYNDGNPLASAYAELLEQNQLLVVQLEAMRNEIAVMAQSHERALALQNEMFERQLAQMHQLIKQKTTSDTASSPGNTNKRPRRPSSDNPKSDDDIIKLAKKTTTANGGNTQSTAAPMTIGKTIVNGKFNFAGAQSKPTIKAKTNKLTKTQTNNTTHADEHIDLKITTTALFQSNEGEQNEMEMNPTSFDGTTKESESSSGAHIRDSNPTDDENDISNGVLGSEEEFLEPNDRKNRRSKRKNVETKCTNTQQNTNKDNNTKTSNNKKTTNSNKIKNQNPIDPVSPPKPYKKPPPINVINVDSASEIQVALRQFEGKYHLRKIVNGMNVYPNCHDDHPHICAALYDASLQFSSHDLQQHKTFQIVLKGMDALPVDEVSPQITEAVGYTPLKISLVNNNKACFYIIDWKATEVDTELLKNVRAVGPYSIKWQPYITKRKGHSATTAVHLVTVNRIAPSRHPVCCALMITPFVNVNLIKPQKKKRLSYITARIANCPTARPIAKKTR